MKYTDVDYMLKSSIYLTLIGYSDSNRLTIPCKVRMEMEENIIKEFNNRLSEYGYIILKKDESKQPQPPISQTRMLGEVPHGVNDQPGENLKAVEGATPVVRQNEQTKEIRTYIEGDDIWTEW